MGESKEDMYFIINFWKGVKHFPDSVLGKYSVPQTVYDWADYGYDGYLRYEKERLRIVNECDVNSVVAPYDE